MQTSIRGIELIKKCEGFSDIPYICAGGKKTIGYGHVMHDSEKYETITDEYATDLLKEDLLKAEYSVERNIKAYLSQSQFDALVSLTFNIGGAALQRSTLRQKINYGADIGEICHEFMRWIYAGGQVLKGLIFRRRLECVLYRTTHD